MDFRIPRIKVLLVKEDGELLDQFIVIGHKPTLKPGEIMLSHDVRHRIEMEYEVEDING